MAHQKQTVWEQNSQIDQLLEKSIFLHNWQLYIRGDLEVRGSHPDAAFPVSDDARWDMLQLQRRRVGPGVCALRAVHSQSSVRSHLLSPGGVEGTFSSCVECLKNTALY